MVINIIGVKFIVIVRLDHSFLFNYYSVINVKIKGKIMRKIILTLIFSCLFVANSFAKETLTILNAGSKTGSFAMQMTAVSKDLQKYYNIDLKIPGDYCTAVQMLKSIKGPVLMLSLIHI